MRPLEIESPTESSGGTKRTGTTLALTTSIGFSILVYPYIFAQVGWLLGTAIIATWAGISMITMRCLVLLKESAGQAPKSLGTLFVPHLGRSLSTSYSVLTILLLCGACTASSRLPIELLPTCCTQEPQCSGLLPGPSSGYPEGCLTTVEQAVALIPGFSFGHPKGCLITMEQAVALIILLNASLASLFRDLHLLDKMVWPFLACYIYVLVLLLLGAMHHRDLSRIHAVAWEGQGSLASRVLNCFAMSSASFGGELCILTAHAAIPSAKRTPVSRFTRGVIDRSQCLLGLLYVAFALSGYCQFGRRVGPNVLLTMTSDAWTKSGQILVSLSPFVKVPLFNILQWQLLADNFSLPESRRTLVLFLANAISLAFALSLGDFGEILGIVGGVICTPVTLLIPNIGWLLGRFYSDPPIQGPHRGLDIVSSMALLFGIVFYIHYGMRLARVGGPGWLNE